MISYNSPKLTDTASVCIIPNLFKFLMPKLSSVYVGQLCQVSICIQLVLNFTAKEQVVHYFYSINEITASVLYYIVSCCIILYHIGLITRCNKPWFGAVKMKFWISDFILKHCSYWSMWFWSSFVYLRPHICDAEFAVTTFQSLLQAYFAFGQHIIPLQNDVQLGYHELHFKISCSRL